MTDGIRAAEGSEHEGRPRSDVLLHTILLVVAVVVSIPALFFLVAALMTMLTAGA